MSKLTLEQANRIINAALGDARAKAYKPMAVVVLDDSGNVKAVQREDGATMFRVDIATGKAWGSVAMKRGNVPSMRQPAKSNALTMTTFVPGMSIPIGATVPRIQKLTIAVRRPNRSDSFGTTIAETAPARPMKLTAALISVGEK